MPLYAWLYCCQRVFTRRWRKGLHILDLCRIVTSIYANQHSVTAAQDIGKVFQEVTGLVSTEVA